MEKVNPYMIRDILGPLGGTADYENDETLKLYDVPRNNEKEVKVVIANYIKPFFDRRNNEYKEYAKRSLAYYLTFENDFLESIYDSCLIALSPPDNISHFYVWIWEVLFGEESYRLDDRSKYCENPDIMEPARSGRKSKTSIKYEYAKSN
jgi:hypothetical protein